MTPPTTALTRLRRPRLLMRAVRFALGDYRRARDLPRLLEEAPADPARALPALLEEEARLETARRDAASGYSPARHVALLAAVLGELRLLREAACPGGFAQSPAAISALRRAT